MNIPPGILFNPSGPVPSPCFVLDATRLKENAAILGQVQEKTGARMLLALKAFSAFEVFPLFSRAGSGPLFGTCASSVDEARLGREKFGGEVHAFAAAWSEEEIDELAQLADHIIFNSISQWERYREKISKVNGSFRKTNPIRCGLRVNPEHSEGAVAIYNPCAPHSRLGIRKKAIQEYPPKQLAEISGLHFHTLCEQNARPLARTLCAFEKSFAPYIKGRQWLNWGGGHHITRPDYDRTLLETLLKDWRRRYQCQIYLEPGEAAALDAGWLVTTVLDIVEADMPVCILDASAACHMPDVLEMPYTPVAWTLEREKPARAGEPEEFIWQARLAGKSCLAGDNIGVYSFREPLKTGDRIIFADMAIYSMVKTTTFNGLRLPSIGICDSADSFRIIKKFGYNDFVSRLS